jgi:cytosine/adenosine deaminase-related metal-dependent hydrolase
VTTFVAEWLLPIVQRPLRRGSLTVRDGRIQAVTTEPPPEAMDLGRVALLPALVNTHTHLELSFLHGRVPPAPSFGPWVQTLMAIRRQYPDPADPRIIGAARAAIARARESGTGLFGDISNTLVTAPMLRDMGLPAHVFHELTGFTEPDPRARVREARQRADAAASADVRVSVAPHAPYSVSAALFGAIREDVDAHASARSSVHLGENEEEVELLRDGTGTIRTVLEDLGRWPADWRPPGCSPVEYLRDLGFLDRRTLAVHGVQFTGEDLATLRDLQVTLVACPRSNVHVGVGSPPLEAFYAMDVEVALGTDSLASVPDLDMFAELAEARRIAPRVPARRLLESATLTGAHALGFEDDFGSLEAGKRSAVLVVRVPEGVADVEEYLVSGVTRDAIAWLNPEGAVPFQR